VPTYATPGAYYEAVDLEPARPVALRTDVAGLTGVASMGPLDEPVRLTSWRQFESTFGGLRPGAFLGYAVKAFFDNGGRACWVVRVAAAPEATEPSDPAVPAAAAPADLGRWSIVDPGARFVPGAVVTVTQDAGPAAPVERTLRRVNATEGRLVWDEELPDEVWLDRPILIERADGAARTLSGEARQPADRASSIVRSTAGFGAGARVRIRQTERRRVRNHRIAAVELNGARLVWEAPLDRELAPGPLAFATGAGAAEAQVANWDGEPVLRIAAASPGEWGNSLRVLLAASTAGSTRTAAALQPDDRKSSLVDDVSGFRPGDLVRLTQSGPPRRTAHLIVAAVDAQRGRLRWEEADGGARFGPQRLPDPFDPQAPIVFDRLDLGLAVYRGAQLLELHPSLSLVPEHPRYAPGAVGSADPSLVAVEDLLAGDRQRDAERLAVPTTDRWLEGGRDGVAALAPGDLIGRDREAGLGALARVDEVAILAAPDAFIQPGREPLAAPVPIPQRDECLPGEAPMQPPERRPSPSERSPAFGPEQAFPVQDAMVAQCERLRDRFAVLDPPPQDGQAAPGNVAAARAWRKRFDSAFAALYFPWLRVRDPGEGGKLRELPPCGHVAGLFARFDLAEGVHRPPANGELRWAQDVATQVGAELQGALNPEGINAIRAFPGRGIRVYGARTVGSDPLWRWVNVRRLISMLQEAVAEASEWAVFEPHTAELRSLLRMGIANLLEAVHDAGGLAGGTPEEAFFVVCDDTNNPREAVDAGRLAVDVGVAPAAPGEFIVFRVGRVDGQIEVSERGAAGLLANLGGDR